MSLTEQTLVEQKITILYLKVNACIEKTKISHVLNIFFFTYNEETDERRYYSIRHCNFLPLIQISNWVKSRPIRKRNNNE